MPTNVAGLLRAVERHAIERFERVGDEFVRTAQDLAPRRTGAGADSIEASEANQSGSSVTIRVTVGEEYMKYQNEGTGVYGPTGTPIRASGGGVLAFDWPAAGGMVFVHYVRGSEATHWWDRTLQAWPQILRRAS